MAKMTKTQKELLALVAILVVGGGALAYFYLGGQAPSGAIGEYQPPQVDTSFSRNVFDNPEYPKLSTPVHLPLDPGPHGRDNPFQPY